MFFRLSLIIEGATESVSQDVVPLKSFETKMFVLMNENAFFEHHRKDKTIKASL